MRGVVACATAIAEPSGLNATPRPVPAGDVAGSANFTPKPDGPQG